MSKKNWVRRAAQMIGCVTILGLGFAGSAQATLTDNNDGTITNATRNTMWLKDANLADGTSFGVAGIDPNGAMNWFQANAWIAAMNTANYLGYNNWRLPKARSPNGLLECSGLSQTNCSGSELGQLYYDELGNTLFNHWLNGGPFQNTSIDFFWTDTELTGGLLPVSIAFGNGVQWSLSQDSHDQSAWAVRDCGVNGCGGTTVPEPSTLALLGLGVGALAWRRRNNLG